MCIKTSSLLSPPPISSGFFWVYLLSLSNYGCPLIIIISDFGKKQAYQQTIFGFPHKQKT